MQRRQTLLGILTALRRNISWTRLSVAAALTLAGTVQAAAPANDNFTNATAISGVFGSLPLATNISATVEPDEPSHAGNAGGQSVWHRWVAPANGKVIFSTANNARTLLAAYSGSALNALTPLAADNGAGSSTASSVTFSVVAGTVYRIAVDGFNGGTVSYILSWSIAGSAGTFQFTSNLYESSENESGSPNDNSVAPSFDGARVTVTRANGTAGKVLVNYRVTDVTAGAAHYSPPAGTVAQPTTNATATAAFTSTSLTFLPADVSITNPVPTNSITLIGHPFANGDVVRVRSTTQLPPPLAAFTNYTVNVVDANHIRLGTGGGPVVFTGAGVGIHTIIRGSVTGVTVVNPGAGYYYSAPAVTIGSPNSSNATAFATVSNGMVTGITLTDGGDGYSGPVTVNLAAPPRSFDGALTFLDFQTSQSFLVLPSDSPSNVTVGLALLSAALAPGESTAIVAPSVVPDLFVPLVGAGSITPPSRLSIFSSTNGVNFERVRFRVNEGVGTATIRVRSGGAAAGTTTTYATVAPNLDAGSDAATAGTDFTSVNGTINWPGGNATFDIDIPIVNDANPEFNEDIGIRLTGGTAPRGSTINAYVTIINDDDPAGSVDQFYNRDYFSGTTPAFNATPGANNQVNAVAVQANGRALIAGDFTSVNSFSSPRIARINTNGSYDTSFAVGGGASGTVDAVVVLTNQKVLIAGGFSSYNGTPRAGVAQLLTNGALDAAFNPGTGANGEVRALAVFTNGAQAGKILVGGDFTKFNGANVGRLALLNPNGSLDPSFTPTTGANGPVHAALALVTGKILIGGDFTTFNGVTRNRLARLNTDGSLDTSFDPAAGADATVYALALDRSTASLVFDRDSANNDAEDRFTVDTGATTGSITLSYDFGPSADSIHVYQGGTLIFDSNLTNGANTATFPYGAGTGSQITVVVNEGSPPVPGTDWQYTLTIVPTGGVAKYLVGGAFSKLNQDGRNRLARLNPDGTVDTTYDPGYGADDTVFTISALPNGTAYIGGAFQSYNSTRRAGAARLLTDGSLDTSFLDTAYNQFAGVVTSNSPFSQSKSFIRALAVQADSNLVVGGLFKNVGGGRTNTTASGLSSPWGQNVSTAPWFNREDIRNRFNYARLLGGATPGPGNIGFTQAEYRVDEFAGQAFINVARTNGSLESGGAQFLTGDRPPGPGAAAVGADYTALGKFLNWNAGSGGANNTTGTTADDVSITVIDDLVVEGDEKISLRLDVPQSTASNGGEVIPIGVALGKAGAVLTIVDDDVEAAIISFATNRFTVDEAAGFATITVTRGGGLGGTVTLGYTTTDGSALDGQDYTSVFGSLAFGPGQTSQTFFVPITDDTGAETNETVNLSLSVISGAVVFPPGGSNATLTIFDNDYSSGQLQFDAPAYAVAETAGSVTVTIQRTGGNVGAITATAFTLPGTALPGALNDYLTASNNLSWADGDTTSRTLVVPILTDGLVEGPENFLVVLTNAVLTANGSNVPVNLSPATVTILDADAYGTLQFAATNFSVAENGGYASITVTRSGGSSGTVSVDYSTADGTAAAGTNYLTAGGTLMLGPGITSTNFVVSVIDDNGVNPGPNFNRTVVLNLSNAANAALGPQSAALLTIVDDEHVNEPAGSVDTTYNAAAGADGFIYALSLMTDGRLLIGGDFSTFNNVSRVRLARLDANGNLDAGFNPPGGASGSVRGVLVQPDGRVLVGGFFTNVAGFARNRVSRLNNDGTTDTTFNPGAGADGPVYALARHSDPANAGRAIVAGGFTTMDSVVRPFLARLNTNGTVDPGFNTGLGPDNTVFAAAVQTDGKVIAGGDFTSVDNQPAPRLARFNPDGSLDTNFIANLGTGFSNSVRAVLVQSDGRIVVGGLFTNFNGAAVARLVRLQPDGTLDPSFAPNFNPLAGGDGSVLALAQQPDGKLIICGDFTRFSDVTRSRITRLNADGTVDPAINFGFGANNFIAAAAVQLNDGKLIVAGGFTTFNNLPRAHLARLHGGVIAGTGRVEFSSATYVAGENETNAVLTIRRVGGTSNSVTVDFTTLNGTAAAGLDYLTNAGPITFPNGEVVQKISVGILDDPFVEGNETVNLTLATNGGSGTTLGNQPVAVLTIVDDDSYVQFSATNYVVNEVAPGGVAPITITRTGGTNGSFTVQFSTGDLSATNLGDYTAVSTTLSFAPGEVSKVVNVPILDDLISEGDEQLALTLFNPVGAASLGAVVSATLTILDNEFAPGVVAFLQPLGYTVDENGTNALITVVRSNGVSGIVTVQYATADGTATVLGGDYVATNGTLTFADGETLKTFNVRINGDALVEANETVLLRLTNAQGATISGPAQVPLTIINNSEAVFGSFRFSAAAYNGPEGAAVVIDVQRAFGSTGTNAIDFAVTPGTATVGLDYTPTNGTLVFPPGVTNLSFSIPLLNDGLVESNETVNLTLANPVGGASLGAPATAVLTIISADARPGDFAFITNSFVVGEAGTNTLITVLRTNGVTGNVSVDVRVTQGSAQAVGDYGLPNNYVTNLAWPAGDSSARSFLIPIVDDLLLEPVESFSLTLTNETGDAGTPVISVGSAIVTILDNEISAGSLDTNFVGAANGVVYALAVNPLDGRIAVGGNFTQLDGAGRTNVGRLDGNGVLDLFQAGLFLRNGTTNTTVRAVAIYTNGPFTGRIVVGGLFDTVAGAARTNLVRFNADGTVDGTFTPGAGANGIVHAVAVRDDGAVVIGGGFTAVGGVPRPFVAQLGAFGAVDTNFTPGAGPDGLVRAVVVQPDGAVVIGGDFGQVNSVASPRVARLWTNGAVDAAFAANLGAGAGPGTSVFALALQSGGRIVVGGSFTNFAGAPAGRVARLNATGVPDATFTGAGAGFNGSVLALAAQPDGKILAGGAFTAFAGLAQGRLARVQENGALDLSMNFGLGADDFVDTIVVQPDGRIVVGGGFTHFNSAPASFLARLNGGANSGSGLIQFLSSATTASESSSNAVITVARLGGLSNTVTANFRTVDATATTPADYATNSGTLTFLAGETYKTFLVPLVNDTLVEGDETVGLRLTSAGGDAYLGLGTNATLTIADDDGVIGFSTPAFAVGEQGGAATINVIRTGGSASVVTVNFATSDGTATADADYTATNGTLTFGVGETNKTFTVPILQDALLEGNETVSLTLQNITGPATLGLAAATLTIVDDESGPGAFGFSSANYSVTENVGTLTITVFRTNGSSGAVSVQYSTSNITAVAGSDYLAASGTLAFGDGEVVKTFDVQVFNDGLIEPAETLGLILSSPLGATLGSPVVATLAILADSLPGYLDENYNPAITGSMTSLSGTVRSASTGLVLPGVQIAIGSVVAISDAAGAYTLSGVPSGAALVNAFLNGYLPFSTNRNLSIVPTNVLNFAMLPGSVTNLVFQANFESGLNGFTISNTFGVGGGLWHRSLGRGTNVGHSPFFSLYYGTNETFIGGGNYDTGNNEGVVTSPLINLTAFVPPLSLSFNYLLQTEGSAFFDAATVEISTNNGLSFSTLINANFPGPMTNNTLGVWQAATADLSAFAGRQIRLRFRFATGDSFGNAFEGWYLDDVAISTSIASSVAPFVITQPQSQTVLAGTPVVMNVVSAGVLPLGYQWTRNGVPLPGQTNSALIFNSVTTNNAGNYAVSVGNSFGSATSAVATLTVINTCGPDTTVGLVHALALETNSSKVVMGGTFTSVNGVALNRIARLLPDGTVDTGFNAGTGANSNVLALATMQDGRVLLGGDFTALNSLNFVRIARLNADGGLDLNFGVPGVGPNASVRAVAVQADGRVLVGGEFTAFGGNSNFHHLVRLNTNGVLDAGFVPNVDGPVFALALQTNGAIIVGGCFDNAGGAARSKIARLNLNGTSDGSFNPGFGADASVRAVAIQDDGRIVIGGAFGSFNGVPADFLARLNGNGSLDTNFLVGGAADAPVNAVTLTSQGRMYVAGAFTHFAGQTRRGFVRLNADGSVDNAFAALTGANGVVLAAVAQPDTALVIGGAFTQVNGLPRAGIARIHGDEGSLFTDIEFNAAAYSIVESAGPLLVTLKRAGNLSNAFTVDVVTRDGTATNGVDFTGGTFTVSFAAGQTTATTNLALINNFIIDGTRTFTLALTNFVLIVSNAPPYPTFEANSNALVAIQDDEQFVQLGAGLYQVVEGDSVVIPVYRTGITNGTASVVVRTSNGTAQAGLDYTGATNVLTFAPGETVKNLVVAAADDGVDEVLGETVFVSLFNPTNALLGSPSSALLTVVDFNPLPGLTDRNFNSTNGTDDLVRSVAVQADGRILIGGAFTNYAGSNRVHIARILTNGALDAAFDPGAGANAIVSGITVLESGKLVISGSFTNYGGSPFNRLARVTAAGARDFAFNPPFSINSAVNAHAVQADGRVVAGGAFSTPLAGVLRLTNGGSTDVSFTPGTGVAGTVNALVMDFAGRIYLGGSFTNVNGTPAFCVARLTAAGVLDTNFTAAAITNGVVYAAAVQPDGKLLIGGEFGEVGGVARVRVARLNADGTLDAGFNPGAGALGTVFTLALQPNGRVVVGGAFTNFNGVNVGRVARLEANGVLDATFNPGGVGADGTVYAVAIAGNGDLVLGGAFTQLNGQARRGVGLLYGDTAGARFVSGTVETNGFRVTFATVPGMIYAVDSRDDFGPWVPLGTNFSLGTSLIFTDTNAPAVISRLYRARLLAP